MREMEHSRGDFWGKSSVVDEEAIDHEMLVGTVKVGSDAIVVRVAQRIDFDLLADPIATLTSPRESRWAACGNSTPCRPSNSASSCCRPRARWMTC
ncbi:hypothetical protein J2S57_004753 [Kineosporia succinea]|uniref:Uncharacterized protein n=1 Tax=Kineosporia succinea TaxID=84632 RepID=A0ABT9P9B0_9ACTN|nr:hypothetical protein [Kineosporia succinea]